MLTWVLLTLFLGLIFWVNRKPSSLPPGRWGLPVVGYIPLYTLHRSEIIKNLRKEYGDIFTWKVGGRVLVGLCDYKLIKTTYSRPECQGRADLYSNKTLMFHESTGIIHSMGNVWLENRRFALQHLKDFGMGKSSMEGIIQHETLALVKGYERTVGTPVEISWNLNVAVLNVIWRLVADQRYETDDKEIMEFNQILFANLVIIQGPLFILNLFPGLEKILPNFILNNWMKNDVFDKNREIFKDFIASVIKTHVQTFNPNNQRDYIDVYLAEVQKQKGNPDAIFKEDYFNLVTSIGDLFFAGSESTSSTMRWMVALMALNPDAQKKMQKEIDQVVSKDRSPSLEDRAKLPYAEAVLLEVQRYASFAPVGIFHTTTEDIQIGDYHLPKDTIMFAAAEVCHRDPKYFERPDEFYPEHFLDDKGQVLAKKEGFLPFSLGRRQCLGEALAKMELFLFATCLFQKFFVAPPKGITIKAESDRTQPLINFIKPYKVIMTKRE